MDLNLFNVDLRNVSQRLSFLKKDADNLALNTITSFTEIEDNATFIFLLLSNRSFFPYK